MGIYKKKPDVIIRNGCIVDGTGKMPYYADLAIVGDKIDYIGDLKGVTAPLDIDAHHKYVTNGFIDSHSHADHSIWAAPECHSFIAQGITTQIVGNCGFSMRSYMDGCEYDKASEGIDCVYNLPGPKYPKGSLAATLDKADKMGVGNNLAWLCGHNDIRVMAECTQAVPTEEQMQEMKEWIREAMDAGFFGFSTGLEFMPGVNSKVDEIVELAKVAGEYDANYSTHMRDEGVYILEAINEFLTVIRATGMRGTVSHLNVKYDNGVPNDYLDKGMNMLKHAREVEHLNVLCDMLPTTFATGGAMALLPSWLWADGWDKAKARLADPIIREKVKNDFCRYWRFLSYGQWDRLLFVQPEYMPEICNKPFMEYVAEQGKEPIDVFLDICMAAPTIEDMNAVHIQGTVFFEQQLIDSVVTDPIYMWMTDATSTYEAEDGPLAKNTANVQEYMSMTYFFKRYVKELGVISIQDACKKVGAVPAQHFALEGRGTLEVGNYADINVFDLEALTINSTFQDPCHYSTGMDYVFINGTPVIAKGEHTNARAGKVLRHLPKN